MILTATPNPPLHFPARLALPEVVIRPLTANDVDRLYALTNHPAVAGAVAFLAYPVARAFIARWIEKNDGGTERVYGIFGEDGLTGQIGAHADPGGCEVEIGYWLGVDFWGRGLASAAARALAGEIQRLNPASTLFAECAPENLASQRVLAKAGFVAVAAPGRRPGRLRLRFEPVKYA